MRRADLPELSAFIAIAEHQRFSGAARVLGVSPSALSHSMRNLEARLEIRLFNRTTRSVTLTEAGGTAAPGCAPVAQLLNGFTTVVNGVTSARNT